MRILTILLVCLLAGLQFRLWIGDGSLAEVWSLRQAVKEQQAENERLSARNDALAAEVKDLKQGRSAVEERARTELGMIAEGETFFQIVRPAPTSFDITRSASLGYQGH